MVSYAIELNPALCDEANRLQLSLHHFGHSILGTWWKSEGETIQCSQLYYIVKGSANVLCNDETLLTMTAGNWYLLPTGTKVKYSCDNFMEEFYFHFKLCDIDRVDLLENGSGPYTLPIREDKTKLFFKLLKSNSPVDGIRLQNELFTSLLNMIDVCGIILKKTELSPCVSKAISYIHSHLSIGLSVSEIVKHSYVSKTTLEKYFKRELGVSVHEYLYNSVMFEASQMLLKTDLPIGIISEQFGFCDQFYFSNRFKETFGKSPKDFRNSVPM
ncbi:MAG: helix-turn-helix transcriptional regulator [Ruminococcaceae bacterium]|nr:helix-turn-helix transcriptional regulator [Oscillospiraceae bacterium]